MTIDSDNVTESDSSPRGQRAIAVKTTLPVLKLNIPLSVGSKELFEIFRNVSRNQSF
jgi:hypothetical protein